MAKKTDPVNAPKGVNSHGVFIPDPSVEEHVLSELLASLSELGKVNTARAGSNWFTAAIKAEILDRGWVQGAGPRPSMERGATSLLDGNGRLQALSQLYREDPEKWGKVKVQVDVYPSLTDEQRTEIIARAGRSTAAFTEADYYKQSMLTWKAHPTDSYLKHLDRMGLERAMLFFTPAPESAIIRDQNGVRLKPGVKDDDLWGKGKGGQKQGPIQVGEVLSRAHPRAVQAFFDQFGNDPAHSISYKELIDCTKQWEADRKIRPDLASPPASFETLIKEFPDSQMVNGVLGQRIAKGRSIQGGREQGKGRMTVSETSAHATTTFVDSRCAPILINFLERTSGYTGEASIRDVEDIFKAVEAMATANLETPEGVAACRKAQETYLARTKAMMQRAGAEAAAQRQRLLEEEAKRSANKPSA